MWGLFRWKWKPFCLCLTVSYLGEGAYKQRCTLPTPAGSRGSKNERPNSAYSNLRGTQMSPLLLEPRRLLFHPLWKLCKSRLRVCSQGGVTRRRDPRTPDSDGGSGDVLDRHKNTCLFPGRRFTVPEIPSEPVSGVQEGVRGWSLGDATLPASGEVADSLLITDTNCNEEIDT